MLHNTNRTRLYMLMAWPLNLRILPRLTSPQLLVLPEQVLLFALLVSYVLSVSKSGSASEAKLTHLLVLYLLLQLNVYFTCILVFQHAELYFYHVFLNLGMLLSLGSPHPTPGLEQHTMSIGPQKLLKTALKIMRVKSMNMAHL